MPRTANPDKVKSFKVPPAKSEYYKDCLDNCNKDNSPNLHIVKCDTPGCVFTATHAEQHSKAIEMLKRHKASQKCQVFQANALISGNTINTLTVVNNLSTEPINGTLAVFQIGRAHV